jgi:endoglucanase
MLLQLLGMSWQFYEAQHSGKAPATKRVPWRGDSHLTDGIVGGWYDAGDHLKLHLPLAVSANLLSQGILEFPTAYAQSGNLSYAKENLRVAVDYLMRCHVAAYEFVGQLGDPGADHAYWGRPEDQTGTRPVYTWTKATPASDLLGAASAALSSASLVFQGDDPTFAAALLDHATSLYAWGASVEGRYSTSFTSVTYVYSSSRFLDKLMLAAAWLHKATGQAGYASQAYTYWQRLGSDRDVVVDWDAMLVPALLTLTGLPGTVPGRAEYTAWLTGNGGFASCWLTNSCGVIARTPGGLAYPSWSQWGNNRYSMNAAFAMAVHYKQTGCAACLEFVKAQARYVLGSATGQSFVVGWGPKYPKQPHHRAASCPVGGSCGWEAFNTAADNPNIVYGALVGGPKGPTDAYTDVRSDYVVNEVGNDYNAGFTGVLAALIELA